MSVEDFNEHKRKRKKASSKPKTNWLKTIYNPRIFRRGNKRHMSQPEQGTHVEYKVTAYIFVLIVVLAFILIFAFLKKSGLVE